MPTDSTAAPWATGRKVPEIRVGPPGPQSRAALARADATFYPGLTHHLAPFVIARKSGHWIEDLDGNVYLDLLSGLASVPFGAANPEIVEPVLEAIRTFGNEDGHFMSSAPMIELAD